MRKIIIVLSSCIVLVLLGYTGYRGYQVWRQSHGMAMARSYFAKNDVRNTMLSLQQVLHINPRNLEACRMMADLTEGARSPGTVVWRQRVLELDPGSLPDRLSLVRAAVIFQDYPLATNALAGAADSDKKTAAYDMMAATVSLVGEQPDKAEAYLTDAIRLDPSDPVPEVNLAAVRLHQTNALDMAEARIALQRVILTSTNAILSSQARRELINDAMRFNDMSTALTLSQELIQQTNSFFTDKLLRLNVLLKGNSAEFKPTLISFRREAATNPISLFDLSNWQKNKLSVGEALGWLQSLPPQTRTNQPAALLAAECQLQLADWQGLQTAIQNENWSEIEYVRHAYLSRCLREQGLAEASIAEWGVALKFAGKQKSTVIALFHLAVEWHWNSEAEQILWIVVNQYPEEKWAAPELERALVFWQRTHSLMRLYDLVLKRAPDNLQAKNNLALTAMLLGAKEYRPYDLAQEVYEKAPKLASNASTYAFALYLQNKYSDALKIMQQLSSKDLENPSTAGYYGLILKANGHNAEARTYLNQSSKARFLPEERALFDQAKAGL